MKNHECAFVTKLPVAVLAGLLFILAAVSVPACQRDGDLVREELRTRQTIWARDLGALRRAVADARASLDALPRAGGDSDAVARRRGMEVILDNDRQALIDVEIQVGQLGQQIEAALGVGDDAGRRMLDEQSARITEYLQAMRQRILESNTGIAALAARREARAASN